MSYAVILKTLEPRDVILLTKQPVDRVSDKRAVMGAYAAFYNQRGGTVEIDPKLRVFLMAVRAGLLMICKANEKFISVQGKKRAG